MLSPWLIIALGLTALAGCNSPRPPTDEAVRQLPATEAPEAWPDSMVAQPLQRCAAPVDLEVGVVVFGAGIDNPDQRDARHKLRSVETRLAAATLRDVMTDSGCWGPVRVLPSASQFAALTVSGTIVHSDGRDLVLDIRGEDASGRVWLDQRLRISVTAADYRGARPEPFMPLFNGIANRLYQFSIDLESAQPSALRRLSETARLRYAVDLAPDAFAQYIEKVQGRVVLQRLPAEDDPMLARIDRIRNQEALFIDTVDEQYVDLRAELGPTYLLWRQSSFEQAEYLDRYTERAAGRELKADRGSFAAMQQVYSTYRSVRIQEQDLFDLATGFDNETAPTVMDSGDRVVRLTGTLDEQYREWRDILARIIRLERGSL